MVEAHWEGVRGEELRFSDDTWELTGDVDVRGSGELVHARAKQVDSVKHGEADLQFGVADAGGSLNPGGFDDVTARVERDGDRSYLVVERDPRTYRYELQSIEYV